MTPISRDHAAYYITEAVKAHKFDPPIDGRVIYLAIYAALMHLEFEVSVYDDRFDELPPVGDVTP